MFGKSSTQPKYFLSILSKNNKKQKKTTTKKGVSQGRTFPLSSPPYSVSVSKKVEICKKKKKIATFYPKLFQKKKKVYFVSPSRNFLLLFCATTGFPPKNFKKKSIVWIVKDCLSDGRRPTNTKRKVETAQLWQHKPRQLHNNFIKKKYIGKKPSPMSTIYIRTYLHHGYYLHFTYY